MTVNNLHVNKEKEAFAVSRLKQEKAQGSFTPLGKVVDSVTEPYKATTEPVKMDSIHVNLNNTGKKKSLIRKWFHK